MNKNYLFLGFLTTVILLVLFGTIAHAAPPVPQDDTYNTPLNTTFTTTRTNGVLANDTDPENNPLRAIIISTPSNSQTFSLSSDGSFVYIPRPGFMGIDTFTYAVIDDTETGERPEGNVTIKVNPVAVADLYETKFEQPLTVAAPGILSNDRPVNSNLQATLFAPPAFGTLALSPNGGFTYVPRKGFSGIDTFSYRVQSGQNLSPAAIVTLSVKQNPVATAKSDIYDTDFSTRLDVPQDKGVLANDEDANSDSLMAQLVDSPKFGTVTLQSNGAFSYTPKTNFYGSDSFTYTVNDGTTTSNKATVQINVRSPRPHKLSLTGSLTKGIIRPKFLWETAVDMNRAFVPAAWYNLVIKKGEATELNTWFEAEKVCTGNSCEVEITPEHILAGLINGAYTWTIQAWNNNIYSTVSVPSTFNVNVPLPQSPGGFTVTALLGRPVIGFPNDANTSWVHVYVGHKGGEVVEWKWYNKEKEGIGNPIRCTSTHCELVLDSNPLNGRYEVWLQVWGPGGFNSGSDKQWSGPGEFSLEYNESGLLDVFTGTAKATSATFKWPTQPGISWYRVWVGTDKSYNEVHLKWHPAHDLGCQSNVCTLDIKATFSPGEDYTWFLSGWGPGGFTTGGQFKGWAKGNNFSL